MRSRLSKEREQTLLFELEALYREVDARFEGASCALSSECCRFGLTGREPQVTSIELALVKRALMARGGALPKSKKALPLTNDGERERVCPLLDRAQRCAVYEARPLGCRTFYCTRAVHFEAPSRRELQRYVRRLQDLAVAHQHEGDKPRALTRALAL